MNLRLIRYHVDRCWGSFLVLVPVFCWGFNSSLKGLKAVE